MTLMDYVRERIEEVGECWEWQLAFHSGGYPVAHWGGKVLNVRRALLKELGADVERRFATYRCGNCLCVRPEHIEAATRAKIHKRAAKKTKYGTLITRRQKLAAAARRRSRLTPEQVEAIRNDSRPQRTVALEYGISQSTVSLIRLGLTWRDYTNPFSQLLGKLT